MASTTPISPKVHAAGISVALVTLAMYLLDQIPAVAGMPVTAKGALLVIVTAAVTYLAGWLATDPLRDLGAKFDNNPTTAPAAPKDEAGEITLSWSLVIAVVLLLAFLFGWGVLH